MDPIPGHKHTHEHREPKTAVEEAMVRLVHAIEAASVEYNELGFFSLAKRFRLRGAIATMTLIAQMLHELDHKYRNTRGEWN